LRAEPRAISVLLLEAGGWEKKERPASAHPPSSGAIIRASGLHYWMYFSEPEPSLVGRASLVAQRSA